MKVEFIEDAAFKEPHITIRCATADNPEIKQLLSKLKSKNKLTKFSKKVKYKQMEENISQPEKKFSPSPSQTIPDSKSKFSLILMKVLLLALGGVGGFLLGRQSLQPKSTTTQMAPLPSEAPVEERIKALVGGKTKI